MKASSHEKHAKQQWKKKKTKQKVQTHGQGLGRGLAGDMGLNFLFLFVFLVLPWFFAVWPKPRENQKKQKKKFRPMGKVWAIHAQISKKQKNKKPKNQETKKPKNQKKQKNQDCTPQGEGVRCRVLGLVFLFFFFFLVFCFFDFLVSWFFGFLFFGLCVDSHCRCAKQRLPGTVSGCTRSKVDTLQYSNVCYDIVHSANE